MPLTNKLQGRRFKSTADAHARVNKLAQVCGWPDHVLSRLAVSRSLREPGVPPSVTAERQGKELRGETFFRFNEDTSFLAWCAAMVAEHAGQAHEDDDIAFELIVAHWHRGLTLLEEDLARHGGDFHTFVLHLARQAAELAEADDSQKTSGTAPAHGAVKPLTVPVGRTRPDAEPFAVTLNDTRKYSNCHTAISGMSGSGKTQLAIQMLSTAAKCIDTRTGIVYIDFAKGDVAGNAAFVASIGARVFRLPGDILPIGAFHLPDYSDDAVRLAAEEKREVYSNLFANLGAKQQGRLVQAIRSSYASLRSESEPAPDFAYVQHMLDQVYQMDGLQPDSLSELFRRLNAYRLFWSRDGGAPIAAPLYTQRWVVDIHELGGLKEVTAFTLIEQLYREMRSLPDSDVDAKTGYRHIRCILAIDESQYYLRAKNRFLQGIIREGRSKGFMVMLMCQSPDDFDQTDFDYTEQLQFTYMLQCKTEPKAVSRLLGIGREEAKRLAADLGRMEPLHGVGRVAGGAGVSRFRVVPFFEVMHR